MPISVSHAGILSKRLNVPSKFLHFLPPAPLFQFYQKSPRLDVRVSHPSTFRHTSPQRKSPSSRHEIPMRSLLMRRGPRCGMKVPAELLSISSRVTGRFNNSHNAVDCYTPTTTAHAGLNKTPTVCRTRRRSCVECLTRAKIT